MSDLDQVMTKLRLRRLLEEVLDSEILQADVDEDTESGERGRPLKRLTLIVRYIPA